MTSSSSAAASTSCVAEVNGSTSTIVAAAKPTGHHILKIDGYSRTKAMVAAGDCILSSRFHAGDHAWRIKYYPNGRDGSKPDAISLMLELDMASRAVADAVVNTQFVFSLLDQDGEPVPSSSRGSSICSFPSPSGSPTWGYYEFIYHDELERSEHLKDDRFAVRCDITVMRGVELRVEPASSLAVPEPDLHHHLGHLLSTGDGADVTFRVAGETFPSHRCVLAARSPVFRAAVYGDRRRPAAGTCLDIHDMDAGAFRALLHFVYTDTLPEMASADVPAMARQLIAAADKYQVERLKLVCEDKLSKRVVADDTSMTTTDSATCDVLPQRYPWFKEIFLKLVAGCLCF